MILLNNLMEGSEILRSQYLKKVRHYLLKEHTLLVLGAFERYFSPNDLPVNKDLFRVFLALHDIGKPLAFDNGDKSNQYAHTKEIIKQIWPQLQFSNSELQLALCLSEGDLIGEYFQNRKDVDSVFTSFRNLSIEYGIELSCLVRLFLIYYQCDIAAYTSDDGGFKFLEHLFEYDSGAKVFDSNSGLLKMSNDYWPKCLNLIKELEK